MKIFDLMPNLSAGLIISCPVYSSIIEPPNQPASPDGGWLTMLIRYFALAGGDREGYVSS